jgi:hypothetical protein
MFQSILLEVGIPQILNIGLRHIHATTALEIAGSLNRVSECPAAHQFPLLVIPITTSATRKPCSRATRDDCATMVKRNSCDRLDFGSRDREADRPARATSKDGSVIAKQRSFGRIVPYSIRTQRLFKD